MKVGVFSLGILLNLLLPLGVGVAATLCWLLLKQREQGWKSKSLGVNLLLSYGKRPLMAATFMLVLGLCVTLYRVSVFRDDIQADAQRQFLHQMDRLEADISGRFEAILVPLRGVRGALLSSDYITRAEFRDFVESRDIEEEFPGIRGLGIVEHVPRAGLASFTAAQRRDGAPGFVVRTSGTAPDLFVIKYIEPLDNNKAALGYDVGSDPVRRTAAEQAMRDGKPALTAPIALVQDGMNRPGFLYFLPYYASVKVPATEAERLRLFRGLAYSPIVLAELLVGVLADGQQLSDFQLIANTGANPPQLLFDSMLPMGQTQVTLGADHLHQRWLYAGRPLLVGGQLLQLRAGTTPDFERAYDRGAPARLALSGSAISVLLGAVVWLLLVTRYRAKELALGMTHELGRLALVAERTNNAVVMTDAQRRITWVNEGFTRMTGFTLDDALGQVPVHLLGTSATDPLVREALRRDLHELRQGRYEVINHHKDGRTYWVDMEVQTLLDDKGQLSGYMAVQTDITAVVQARQLLELEQKRSDDILAGTNIGTWQSNFLTGESVCNDRWSAMMGFAPEEVVPNPDAFWSQRVHPDDLVRSQNAMQRCREGHADEYSIEVRVRRKDSRWMWIASRAKVMSRTADGQVEWVGGIHTDISDAKSLEMHLRDMEQFLRRAGQLAGVGAWEVDLKTMTPVWSEQTCIIHGVQPGFKPTMDIALSFYSAKDKLKFEAAIDRAIAQGLGWDITTRLFDAQGQAKWVRSAAEPEFDDSGAVRLVGAFQDVTAARESQIKVERSEAILRESIDAVNEAYVLYDPQDRLAFCNEKYRELYATSADLIVPGASFESIIRGGAERGQYAEAVGRVDDWVAERMKAHLAGNTNMEQHLDDGRWLRVVERMLPDGHRVGFRVDITQLKQSHEEVQAANVALAKTTATLQAVLDSALDVGVIATDMDRRVTVFNRGAENLLGYSSDELMGKRSLGRIFERSQMAVLRESLALTIGREPDESDLFAHAADTDQQVEWTLLRKDGSVFVASLSISRMVGAGGEMAGFLAIAHDITRQKDYENSLRNAMRAAEQSSVAKSQFLANMSHEIRTPMNAILGMLQLLHATPLSPRQLDYTSKTEGAAKSLLGLLNDILDFSKVEAGKMELDLEPFELSRLLGDLSVILSSNLGAKNVDLVFDVDPHLPKALVGDALRIKQVLVNLGGNAVKFTERGEVVVRWRLVARTQDSVRVEISVIDSGIGIAPQNQSRIFEAFTQAESSTTRRFGGTGLGLVISTRLIRLMGGELALRSELGRGSTFSWTMDFQVADADAAPPVLPAIGPGLQTLLVDDNPVALNNGAAMMRTLGWQVIEAASGEEAIAAVRARQAQTLPAFDALFVDWQMPGMDGWETLRNIRRIYADTASPLLVMMSAQSRAELAQRTGREQELLNGFLVKPLTAEMFRDSIAHASDRQIDIAPAQGLKAASGEGSQAGARRLAGMRILVVEDNPINQQVAQELLSAQGARVMLADNGQAGVDAVLGADPMFDVVLMDLQMPVMDGVTAARTLRQHQRLKDLPVIAMTANAMASDREACLAAGMNDHVGKPFDLADLVQTLVRHTGWEPSADPIAATLPYESPPIEWWRTEAWPAQVDVFVALSRMGGNVDLFQRSMNSYVRDARTLLPRLQVLLKAKDRAAVQRELHAFKGLSATLGVSELCALAAHAEKLFGAAADSAAGQTALTALGDSTAHHLGVLGEVLQRFADRSALRVEQGDSGGAAAVSGPGLLARLRELLVALQASDMTAMELHASVRQSAVSALGDAMEPLDAAMAELEFDAAAVECEKLVSQLS